jgi:hypothetical protein
MPEAAQASMLPFISGTTAASRDSSAREPASAAASSTPGGLFHLVGLIAVDLDLVEAKEIPRLKVANVRDAIRFQAEVRRTAGEAHTDPLIRQSWFEHQLDVSGTLGVLQISVRGSRIVGESVEKRGMRNADVEIGRRFVSGAGEQDAEADRVGEHHAAAKIERGPRR